MGWGFPRKLISALFKRAKNDCTQPPPKYPHLFPVEREEHFVKARHGSGVEIITYFTMNSKTATGRVMNITIVYDQLVAIGIYNTNALPIRDDVRVPPTLKLPPDPV